LHDRSRSRLNGYHFFNGLEHDLTHFFGRDWFRFGDRFGLRFRFDHHFSQFFGDDGANFIFAQFLFDNLGFGLRF
jgi:hypothetical protein